MNFKEAKQLFYHGNRLTMSSEEKKALREAIIKAADAEDATAEMLAGRLYYEGFTVRQDFTRARTYFEKADAQGEPWGTVYLAYCYYYGRDIPKDYKRAYTLFRKAAKQNNHCALYKLGDMYRDGLYVPKNNAKALSYYEKAFALIDENSPEHPNIAARIGHMLLIKNDTPETALSALSYLHQAEEGCYRLLLSGDPYAHLSLPQIAADENTAEKRIQDALSGLKQQVFYT